MKKNSPKIGDILMPNEYLRANKTYISGLIIEEKDDIWGMNYKIALTNGNVVWKDESTIRDLWDIIENDKG
jgi:hypothetical protein